MNSQVSLPFSIAHLDFCPPVEVNLFVRQAFTESTGADRTRVQSVIDLISGIGSQWAAGKLNLLTGSKAESAVTFKSAFETASGLEFSPSAFRRHRLDMLDRSDAMIVVRTSMSESSAFEVAYSVVRNPNRPIFFAVHESAPFKTTLLRDLQDISPAVYVEFADPEDLRVQISGFLNKIIAEKISKQFCDREVIIISDRDVLDNVEIFIGNRQDFRSVSSISECSISALTSSEPSQICRLLEETFPQNTFFVIDTASKAASWARAPKMPSSAVDGNWAFRASLDQNAFSA